MSDFLRRRGLTSRRRLRRGNALLVTGILIALLTDGIASTILSFALAELNGAFATTPDRFAWLTLVYLAAKILGFLAAPWFCGQVGSRQAMMTGVSLMVTLFCLMTLTEAWQWQIVIFIGLGIAGGMLLIAAQALLFQTFARPSQPRLQLLYALGSSAGAAALAPGLQGWILNSFDWRWIAAAAVAAGLLALALLHATRVGQRAVSRKVRFDGVLVMLLAMATVNLSYVAVQGERWNWFDETRIVAATCIGLFGLLLAANRLIRQAPATRMLDLSIFSNFNFSLAFLASFVAGFALFGTAYLIPAYAAAGLGMSSLQIGEMLLPGVASFTLAMCIAVFVLPKLRIPPVITIPIGIILLMTATWLLGHQARGASVADLMPAILLRGGGLGLLFLAITLLALMWMPGPQIPHGAALMSAARQFGGLAGTGLLSSVVTRQSELNSQMLSAHLTSGNTRLTERIATMTAQFAYDGMSLADATALALGQIGQQLAAQASAVAWNRAFLTVTLFFCLAAPTLIMSRFILLKVLAQSAKSPAPAMPVRPPEGDK